MADSYIDMSFGTAVMKCTPAHDPNDFALAKKYGLSMPICMHDNGTMNDMCVENMPIWIVLKLPYSPFRRF